MVSDLFPLILSDVAVRRRGKSIIGPVNLTVGGQGVTVVLGPNGAGKTTLLRTMHGVERVSRGQVAWGCSRSEADLRQSFVFQQPILLRRSALENVVYPVRLRGADKASAKSKAIEMLDMVGLEDAATRPAHGLSGGERQKLALARALATGPEVLFLDEPTASLDGRSTREIETVLANARAAGVCLIMATHDLGQARRLADEVLFLYHGRIHESGPADAFFDQPQTVEAKAFLKGDILE